MKTMKKSAKPKRVQVSGKFTTNPTAIKRAIELRSQKKAVRAIADALLREGICDVSHQTIANYFESVDGAENPTTTTTTVLDAMPELDPNAPADVVRARCQLITKLIGRIEPGVEAGTYPPAAYASLVRLEGEMAARLVALIPPAPVDPENDPYNREAAERFVEKMRRAAKVAEERFKCHACGQSPYPPKQRLEP
jgi:hypothetical protein